MKKTTRTRQKSGQGLEKKEGENAVLAKIAAMPGPYHAMGERLHALIKASAPVLTPKTWYGMPAYAKDGKVICFFRGDKNERYLTLGFSEDANLDEDNMWPTSYALKKLTATEEERIAELVKKAVS
ncbi:iron chaperone [Methanobacterium sp. BAmetb5]|uniref:iron chaperone n=1 Tax=Methanobacterium sp. BAmetb5 TaxID=2025351 RepID=UPI0025D61B7B|nr:DUF1801 domain-containing protein [Methanobacterium sp. BAmetb5]